MSKVIKMFYELKDAKTGELLESNIDGQEIAFVSGKNQVLESLEAGVINLKSGESTIISIPAAQGVGEYDEAALQVLPKEQFAGIELNEGMELFGEGEDGSSVRVIVKAIGENEVTVDFNHPYAGRDLEFNVKITENRDADADEELTGVVAMPHVCGCGGHGHHHEHGGGGCCGGHGHNEDHEDGECCGGHGHGKDGGGCCGKHNH
ncbi:FKBP-type peptidyl-prolyl cis-trans isomerase [Campylobacter hyointestinalis]|uniref:Peptidyl-prolyl cis-trans isomerase n=1 Tax=Campylobacter hyointestinalis subsp. hyointestinalis TaxID=91352 RepID=A0A855NCB9_CAMHY|nr:FKBP-type peptidyl-prolyl cis-trans isomerase [Campylobacter hyointestinalis]KEA44768.1 peptidylprolyl isomerase [Campylobacter hyointestinalis subsp. hyointestinalis]MDY2998324.1 FKBP-type peptidyl-prolyl cis-trans isomerase [Campylobacter hyointestinalis]PPB59718.1 peptidylprolyl isomerase [Campylobacter hyointestinalis subsp. hyointestinalis]PPB64641.1 peptidylprolyl isomerase [Campylobacter hyointestinalis subsp. hyointestinalis]PPB72445.1 peptidylprolyl isomerase [Campylobacter hyointe